MNLLSISKRIRCNFKNEKTPIVRSHFWMSAIFFTVAVAGSPLRGQSISSTLETNWNKTPAGDELWMSSVFTMKSPVTEGETVLISNASVSFPFNHTPENVGLPNAEIIFSSAYSTPATTFNSATDTWITTVPLADAHQNIFLTGGEWQVPYPGILHNISGDKVSMSADFSVTNTAAPAELEWKWSAAAYNTFSSDLNSLGVLTLDHSGLHAGTPTSYASSCYLDQGGSGGGGCNFTGSYSCTADLCVPAAPVPEPGSAVFLIAAATIFVLKRGKFRKLGA